MKLEIRDKDHAAILEKVFHAQEIIEFHGVSMAIHEFGFNFDGRPSWTVGLAEVFKPQWKEGGKPPAGTICEYTDVHGLKWYGCEIIAYHGDHVWLRTTVAQRDHVKVFGAFRFRPLRTAEQIEADERLHKIKNACTDIAAKVEPWNEDIDCSQAMRAVIEAMIDAGYRK